MYNVDVELIHFSVPEYNVRPPVKDPPTPEDVLCNDTGLAE
jgi:hypothetical protein